jgi:hypothetical protein
LNNYELVASIHTVQLDSVNLPKCENFSENCIKTTFTPNRKTGIVKSRNIINPHYYGEGELTCYSHYENVMKALIQETDLNPCEYSRIDIRLDSYEKNYRNYFKLNSLFIALFAVAFKFKNDEPTVSSGLVTRNECGVYVKNHYMGIDYYDKHKESEGKFPCKARLEFRAMKLKGKSPEEVKDLWFKRFDKLPDCYEALQDKCNTGLFECYKDRIKQTPKDSGQDILTAFIREHQASIFTARQLIKLCEMCGSKTPVSRAKNLKQTCSIEYISHADIRTYISKIKKFITEYFER